MLSLTSCPAISFRNFIFLPDAAFKLALLWCLLWRLWYCRCHWAWHWHCCCSSSYRFGCCRQLVWLTPGAVIVHPAPRAPPGSTRTYRCCWWPLRGHPCRPDFSWVCRLRLLLSEMAGCCECSLAVPWVSAQPWVRCLSSYWLLWLRGVPL